MYKTEDNTIKSPETSMYILLCVKPIVQKRLIFKMQASLTGVIEKKVFHSL